MTKRTAPKSPAPQPAATGLAGWVEVFRAGAQTDSKGRQITFSRADLDQMAANHKLGAAPAVLGHPKGNDPAYAWVGEYKREGDSLFARFEQIHPAFEEGVKSGAYRNRSLSLFKDGDHGWRVRHVGWLGAQPPAIDGLQPVEFAADDDQVAEFSAPGYSLVWGLENVVAVLRGLREQMIAKDGIEAADVALPQWRIESALESATQARAEFQQERLEDATEGEPRLAFSGDPGGTTVFTQADIDAAAARARQEAEEASRAEFAARDAELQQLREQQQTGRIKVLIEGWTREGRVTPAEQAGLAEFMAALEAGTAGEFTFSAPDRSEVKKTPSQFFAEFMARRAPVVKLSTAPGGDPVGEPAVDGTNARALADAALEFQRAEAKAGRTIPIEQAVAHVSARRA